MGFYLRKSFRLGPVRINLSKSGLGASVGAPGARVGMTSQGRPYVHAGRGGLYYRRHFGGRSRAGEPTGGRTSPIVLRRSTDATYAPEPRDREVVPLDERLARRRISVLKAALLPPLLIVMGVAAAVAVAEYRNEWLPFAVVVPLTLLIAWPVLVVRALYRNFQGGRFGRRLERFLLLQREIEGAALAELRAILVTPGVTANDRDYFCKQSYLAGLGRVVEDSIVEDGELTFLSRLESEFGLPETFVRGARIEVFRRVYLETVGDHQLSEGEQDVIDHIRGRLDLADEDVSEETETVEKLREIRRIRDGELPEVDAGIPLRDGERCHFAAPGRLVKVRMLDSFRRDGLRYKVEGLVVDKEGELLITDRRLLLVHDGTTSIPLRQILDVEFDGDENLIAIVRDGVRRPALVTTPAAARAAAVLATLAGM